MSVLTVFGVAAVSLMLLAYALEQRAPMFVLLFAVACAASSLYGFLAGAWPFGVVEAVWTVVALRRWRSRVAEPNVATTRPIACDMTALSAAERRRYDTLRADMLHAVDDVHSAATGYRLRLQHGSVASDLAEWMALEHRCCPFLTLRLTLQGDGATWIEIGGSAAIKTFLDDEFKGFARA